MPYGNDPNSKSQIVRDYLAEHPEASDTEVADAMKVDLRFVSGVRSRERRNWSAVVLNAQLLITQAGSLKDALRALGEAAKQ